LNKFLIACLLWTGALVSDPAAADPPPLSVYGSLPGFEMAALSPSGARIALVGVANDKRRLIVLDADRKPMLIYDTGDQKLRRIKWAGEDRVVVWLSNTASLGIGFTADKAELSSALVIPVDNSKGWAVFEGRSSITGGVRGFYGMEQHDGHWYGYFGGITLENERGSFYLRDTSAELYEVDMADGDIRRIARRASEGTDRDWVLGPDGAVTATLDFYPKEGNWRIRNGEGKEIAAGRNPLGGIGLISGGRTPGTILYSRADESTGADSWFEIPQAGGESQEILADTAVRTGYVDDRSRQLIGYQSDADKFDSIFFDPHRQKVMQGTRKAFPGLNVMLQDWNDAFDRLIVSTDGPGDPGTWWEVDIKTGQATDLGMAYTLRSADVGPMRMVAYKAQDGLAMSGVLTLPPGRDPKALPIVVLPHGGPASRDYPGFDWWAQAFASRGYAVFQPNFRGSTGFGAAFEKAGHGEWGRKMQTDISDGVAELARQGIVDPKRACIVGASYGGYAALAGVTLQQGLYRCAVAVAGVSDLQAMYRSDVHQSGEDRTLIRSLKDEIGSGKDLKAVSPVNFADKADAPVLLIHGKDDTVVLYAQSMAMERALRRAGKPVEMITLAGEDHWLSRGATRLKMLEAAVAFVERNNPAGK
jgi:dipeptidyl aminopeptidase/acylaminoacyl peptidase